VLKGAYSKKEWVVFKEKGIRKEREGTSMYNDGVAKLVVAHIAGPVSVFGNIWILFF
jgi:hypothetical protein